MFKIFISFSVSTQGNLQEESKEKHILSVLFLPKRNVSDNAPKKDTGG